MPRLYTTMTELLLEYPQYGARAIRVASVASLDKSIPQSIVYVTDPAQLVGELSSDVVYEVSNSMTLTASLAVPANGLYLRGRNVATTSLALGAGAMFVNGAPLATAGNLYISNITLAPTGSVFDIKGVLDIPFLELHNVKFLQCGLGVVDNYARVTMDNIQFNAVTAGLILTGAIHNLSTTNMYDIGGGGAGPYFLSGSAGAAIDAPAIRGGWHVSNINMLDAAANTKFTDAANAVFAKPGGFNVSNVIGNYAAGANGLMPNIVYDEKVSISNCSGMRNTSRGGQIVTTADFVQDAGPEADKANATIIVATDLTNADSVTKEATNDAGLQYTGAVPKLFTVSANLLVAGGGTVEPDARLAVQLYQGAVPIGMEAIQPYMFAGTKILFVLSARVLLSTVGAVSMKVRGIDAADADKNYEPTVYTGATLALTEA
jgi:hypothetical protein